MDVKDKDHLFDKLIAAVDIEEEKNTWSSLWIKARNALFSSMAEEHVKIILEEQKKINDGIVRFRDGECHNFFLIVSQIIFFHCHSILHNLGKKYPLFLPSHVAQKYIKNDDHMLDGICRKCDYMTFGPHFNGKCPYCESLQ